MTEDRELEIKNFITSIQKTEEKISNLQSEMRTLMHNEFESAIKKIFQLVPRLKAIAWTQYSPYFNDGDECVFSVHTPSALSFVPDSVLYEYDLSEIEDEDGDESEHFVMGECDINLELLTETEREAIQGIMDFIESHEDLMEDLYGNHVEVILTENETNISEASHD